MPSMNTAETITAPTVVRDVERALAERDTAVIETLHCKACDQDFTRERKRGVKPSVCSACKAEAAAEHTPRETKTTGVERLDRDEIILTCVEYGVTPRIAIPFMLIGEQPPRSDTLWSFKQAKVINGFDPDLLGDDDFDPLTGAHVGGESTLSVHGLDLYSVPTL
jgi:hypothetical protein